MRKCNVVKLNTRGIGALVRNNGTVILMLVISVTGMLLGALSVKNNSFVFAGNIEKTFSDFIQIRGSASFFRLFFNSFLYILPFAVAVYLSGTSIVGIVTIPTVICYFSYSYGQLAGYLYKNYALTGIGFTMLILVPVRIVAMIGLIYAAKESMSFSVLMASLTLQLTPQQKTYASFKNYCRRYLLVLAVVMISSVIDCLLSSCFLHFFIF